MVVAVPLLSRHAIPLYDGVGFPDEAYRYVQPPSSAEETPAPPSTAEAQTQVINGVSTQDLALNSQEQGPQVTAFIRRGTIYAADTASLSVYIRPEAPRSANKLVTGHVTGNLYHLVASQQVTFKGGSNKAIIQLRLPKINQGESGVPTIEYQAALDQSWRSLATSKVGNDIYMAPMAGFGYYVLAVLPAGAAEASDRSPHQVFGLVDQRTVGLVAGFGLLLASMACVVLIIRGVGRK
jgi:hypothetical protein